MCLLLWFVNFSRMLCCTLWLCAPVTEYPSLCYSVDSEILINSFKLEEHLKRKEEKNEMNNSTTNEYMICGVQYKCRTCFDAGTKFCSLTDKFSGTKTWRNLLDEVTRFMTNNEQLLPKMICCKCIDKLVSHYNFQLQMQNVNMMYSQLLSNPNNIIQKSETKQFDKLTECPTKSSSTLPLEQYVTEIKMEDECVVPYDIALGSSNLVKEEKNEDNYDSIKETRNENFKLLPGDEQRSLNEEINDVLKSHLNENSSSCSEESDYTNDENKNEHKRYSTNRLPKVVCEHNGKAFECTTLNQQDIQDFHNIFYAQQSRAQQDAFILKFCSTSSIQRRRPRNHDRGPKSFQTKCYVPKYNNSKLLVAVCQKTFLAVLCLTRHRFNYVTKIFHEQGILPTVKRGGDQSSHKLEMTKQPFKSD